MLKQLVTELLEKMLKAAEIQSMQGKNDIEAFGVCSEKSSEEASEEAQGGVAERTGIV